MKGEERGYNEIGRRAMQDNKRRGWRVVLGFKFNVRTISSFRVWYGGAGW